MGSSPSIPEGAAEFEDTEALLKAAKTGDVLLFCGRGFFSSIVRFGSVGRIGWSHSAVVVTGKTATGGKAVWLVESNPPLPMTDLITLLPGIAPRDRLSGRLTHSGGSELPVSGTDGSAGDGLASSSACPRVIALCETSGSASISLSRSAVEIQPRRSARRRSRRSFWVD